MNMSIWLFRTLLSIFHTAEDGILSGSKLFAQTKTIFRDRNKSFDKWGSPLYAKWTVQDLLYQYVWYKPPEWKGFKNVVTEW